MTTKLTLQLLKQLQKSWKETKASPEWSPTLLYCGTWDDDVKAFPVTSEDDSHYLWIPRECKFGLRFMNHVLYCVSQLSRSPAFPDNLRRIIIQVAQYTDELRSHFFDEVLNYWYPAGTQLPTQARPDAPSRPLESRYLASFFVFMYHRDTPTPLDVWPVELQTSDPVKFSMSYSSPMQ